jgi:ribosomal protein L37AE/L43A
MKCPKCKTEMDEDPEDSSEWYCPKCNFGYRYDRYGERVKDEL